MRSSLSRFNVSGTRQGRGKAAGSRGATDFLRAHDRMAALLSFAERLVAIERDCAALLPTVFAACRVLHLNEGQLVLAVPNPALAAKLKQQLPKLQDGLAKRGWQVSAIRLKLQGGKISEKPRRSKELVMPEQATAAFSELDRNLAGSAGNEALRAALHALLARHRP